MTCHIGVSHDIHSYAFRIVDSAATKVGRVLQRRPFGIQLGYKCVSGAPVSSFESSRSGWKVTGKGLACDVGRTKIVHSNGFPHIIAASTQKCGINHLSICT